MKNTLLRLIASACLMSASAYAMAEHSSSGRLKYSYSYNYEQDSAQASKLLGEYSIDSYFDGFSSRIEFGVLHDGLGELGYGQDEVYLNRTLKPLRFGHSELGLNDAFIKFERDSYQLTLGKQVVSWGRADAMYLLNTINPFDLRESLILDDEEKFLGLWMLNSQFYFSESEFQLLVIPDANGHILPCQNCQYQMRAPRFHSDGIEQLQRIDDQSKKSASLKNTSVAARWSSSSDGLDYTINIMRQLAHAPALHVTEQNAQYKGVLERDIETKLGGSLSFASEAWAYRFEGMVFLDRAMTTKHITLLQGSDKTDGFEYLFGFDYFGFNDATLMLQFHQHVITAKPNALKSEQYRERISVTYDSNYLNQRLMLRAFLMVGLDDSDSYAQFDLQYNHFDGFFSFVRLDAFSGKTYPQLGDMSQFNLDSRIAVGFEYNF